MSAASSNAPVLQQEEAAIEEQYSVLFCRALYDYEAQDPSALSFRRDDIIEVLTQQPSGWWDGLLGKERGWFPSNYVVVISDEEAELAFSTADYSTVDGQNPGIQHNSNDISHSTPGGTQAENDEWLDNELSFQNGLQENSTGKFTSSLHSNQPSDFWMPEVTPDGQIYYVNTQTGQRSRDIPRETDDEVSDGDLAGLTSQTSSRSGISSSLAFGVNDNAEASSSTEDIYRQTSSAEDIIQNGADDPWVKKLADDGVSFYYFNTVDGRVLWTAPDKAGVSTSSSSLPARQPDTSGLSVYSDDSDIQPFNDISSSRPRPQNGKSRHVAASSAKSEPKYKQALMELTASERIAKALQQTLEPSPPSPVTDLSAIAKFSIQAIIKNLQSNGGVRKPEDDKKMDQLVNSTVLAVRNLLYISAAPTSQIPNNLLPRNGNTRASTPLKPAQRKVTATLSRLVLSARAMQYDSGSQLADTLNRIEADSEELEKAVLSFVLEAQRHQVNQSVPRRLQGVFTTANIGMGLVGAGAAGSWKGHGYVLLDDEAGMPQRTLGTEAVTEIKSSIDQLQTVFLALGQALRSTTDSSVQEVRSRVQELVTHISAFLSMIADIHVARHVDIDGIRQAGNATADDRYSRTVENARGLVRSLETVVQAIYDDSSALLITAQGLHDDPNVLRGEREASYDLLDSLSSSLNANMKLVKQTFEGLLSVGHEQADVAQGDYNGSIEWRMSRLSVINDHFGGALHASTSTDPYYENEDVVDMELAFSRSGTKKADTSYDSYRTLANPPNAPDAPTTVPTRDLEVSSDSNVVSPPPKDIQGASDKGGSQCDDTPKASRPAGANKLHRLLGDEYADKVAADYQPWYLRPNYLATDILIEPDGSVRGGTVPALVERLTAHEQVSDPTFGKAFLMTYKSFTTLDDVFDLLVARFHIQPPENLTQLEREDWCKLKQHVIQVRVLNTLKSMIVDDDVLEKEDLYILDRMKEFISTDGVSNFAAAKQLLILIERTQRGGDGIKMMVNTNQLGPPPPPLIPKFSKQLKLLDIEPLELARQLTIIESQLYQKIKPMECLLRSREQRTENVDNITRVIQTSNRIADWVAESVLSKNDSRRRAQTMKHLISVADRCRTLNNFSTMIAITSGLNTPPIRRLKRTWEQVNQRTMAQFGACEMTIDSNKNFTKYRQLMASVNPPCVPFIGVFLSTLQFIQDGNPDNLPGNLVNFRKRQKASEVINDIKRWQAQSFNFQSLPSVIAYIEEQLNQHRDTRASGERFWALSLELEPREREDEKMARLLQESGFL